MANLKGIVPILEHRVADLRNALTTLAAMGDDGFDEQERNQQAEEVLKKLGHIACEALGPVALFMLVSEGEEWVKSFMRLLSEDVINDAKKRHAEVDMMVAYRLKNELQAKLRSMTEQQG